MRRLSLLATVGFCMYMYHGIAAEPTFLIGVEDSSLGASFHLHGLEQSRDEGETSKSHELIPETMEKGFKQHENIRSLRMERARHNHVKRRVGKDKPSATKFSKLKCRCEYPSENLYVDRLGIRSKRLDNERGDPYSAYVTVDGFTVLPSTFVACQGVVYVCPDSEIDGALWNYDCTGTGSQGENTNLNGYVVVLPTTYFLCQCKETTTSVVAGSRGSGPSKRHFGKSTKTSSTKGKGTTKKTAGRALKGKDSRNTGGSKGRIDDKQSDIGPDAKQSFGKSRKGAGKKWKGAKKLSPITRESQFLPPIRCPGYQPVSSPDSTSGASPQPQNIGSSTFPPTTQVVPISATISKSIYFPNPQPSTGSFNKLPGLVVPERPPYHLYGNLFDLTKAPLPSPAVAATESQNSPTSQPTSRVVQTSEPVGKDEASGSYKADPNANDALPGVDVPDRPNYNITGEVFGITAVPLPNPTL